MFWSIVKHTRSRGSRNTSGKATVGKTKLRLMSQRICMRPTFIWAQATLGASMLNLSRLIIPFLISNTSLFCTGSAIGVNSEDPISANGHKGPLGVKKNREPKRVNGRLILKLKRKAMSAAAARAPVPAPVVEHSPEESSGDDSSSTSNGDDSHWRSRDDIHDFQGSDEDVGKSLVYQLIVK